MRRQLVLALVAGAISGCGASTPWVGTWHREAAFATELDLDGQPIAWCGVSDHTLVLEEDGSYTETEYRTGVEVERPADCPSRPDEDTARSASGTWIVMDWEDDGAYVLTFRQTTEILVVGEEDPVTTTGAVDWGVELGYGSNDQGDYLWLDGIGLFQAVGEDE